MGTGVTIGSGVVPIPAPEAKEALTLPEVIFSPDGPSWTRKLQVGSRLLLEKKPLGWLRKVDLKKGQVVLVYEQTQAGVCNSQLHAAFNAEPILGNKQREVVFCPREEKRGEIRKFDTLIALRSPEAPLLLSGERSTEFDDIKKLLGSVKARVVQNAFSETSRERAGNPITGQAVVVHIAPVEETELSTKLEKTLTRGVGGYTLIPSVGDSFFEMKLPRTFEKITVTWYKLLRWEAK